MKIIVKVIFLSSLLLSCSEAKQNSSSSNEVATAKTIAFTTSMDSLGNEIDSRVPLPEKYERVTAKEGTFAHYLQNLPLKPVGSKVLLFDGREKYRQDVHAAVLDIDVGKRDLQQCADAIMRLRAEYLWQQNRFEEIHFDFNSGFKAEYSRWRNGERIRVKGNQVNWVKTSSISNSYEVFRKYLTMVFAYAGTYSLAQEMKPQLLENIEIGNVFIQGGSPGHAVLVVDKAVHSETGETLILLAQSYMPAQDIHVLKNWKRPDLSPWYSISDFTYGVSTPEWDFRVSDLKQF
ncbi:MAG: DUF4846 domain-containing protein [Bacteroidota bacterium]